MRARLFAALIALTAAAGLILQFVELLSVHSALGTLWTMSRFFTITTNLATALIFAGIAASMPSLAHPRLLAGLTLSILLVGIVYGLLLQGVMIHKGLEIPADTLMHRVTPIMVPLFWLAFVHKGEVLSGDPIRWAIYPFVYLFYALARGLGGDKYAYPFIDPKQHGWLSVAITVAIIAAGFLVAGYGLLWLDRRLATRHTK